MIFRMSGATAKEVADIYPADNSPGAAVPQKNYMSK